MKLWNAMLDKLDGISWISSFIEWLVELIYGKYVCIFHDARFKNLPELILHLVTKHKGQFLKNIVSWS